jgi:hypothetical protein
MKKLEKTVHFVAEGTSVGCYDSKGNPMKYIMIGGEPFIALNNSDRLLDIKSAKVHNTTLEYYKNYMRDFGEVDLKGVVSGCFIGKSCSVWNYAERHCTKCELASFHLAMYKAYKNAMKLEVKNG